MDYISTQEAAIKWGISLRYVQRLLLENRIPGAKKCGSSWLVPSDAEKPMNLHKVKKQSDKISQHYTFWAATPLSKHNLDSNLKNYPKESYAMIAADLAYRRGNSLPAIELWNNADHSNLTNLSIPSIATVAAISTGNFELFYEIRDFLHSCMKRTNNELDKALLSLPETLAAVSMKAVNMTPQWLKDADFSMFPQDLTPFLLYLHALHLRNVGDKLGTLYTARTSYKLCANANTFTWIDVYNLVLCALASYDLGQNNQMRDFLFDAMDLGLSAGMIMPFADYMGTFGGLLDGYIEIRYPQYRKRILKCWSNYGKNWLLFHNKFTNENITTILSVQEFQLARLIANGATYAEASRQMNLSIGRTKNILLDIYGKLLINKRSQLNRFII